MSEDDLVEALKPAIREALREITWEAEPEIDVIHVDVAVDLEEIVTAALDALLSPEVMEGMVERGEGVAG